MKQNKYIKRNIDKGFVLSYFKLSYRRKFIRTLWTIPVLIFTLFLLKINGAYGKFFPVITLVLIVMLICQLIYNYKKWISGK